MLALFVFLSSRKEPMHPPKKPDLTLARRHKNLVHAATFGVILASFIIAGEVNAKDWSFLFASIIIELV